MNRGGRTPPVQRVLVHDLRPSCCPGRIATPPEVFGWLDGNPDAGLVRARSNFRSPAHSPAGGAHGDPHIMSMATTVDERAARPAATHVREHTSLLAAAEKACPDLAGGAHAVLGDIGSPDRSWTRIDDRDRPRVRRASGTPGALLLVPCFLAMNWFGDSLDGTVARVRRQQRPRYGYYLDHVVDLANSTCCLAEWRAPD